VAHISQPDPQEFSDPDHLKKTHLGYRGVQRLINDCKPRLTIISEFWAGLADLRIDLVQGLRQLCGTNAILPGSVGLLINPRTFQIACTACRMWVPVDRIAVGSPAMQFGPLSYLCPECRA
jgi:hypothetical protein